MKRFGLHAGLWLAVALILHARGARGRGAPFACADAT